jgi:hypothetical protein
MLQVEWEPTFEEWLYMQLVHDRNLEAAEMVFLESLPSGSADTGPLWQWRLLHFAKLGDHDRVRKWLETATRDSTPSFNQWRSIVAECETHRIGCGTGLRNLLFPNLPNKISIPDLMAIPFVAPDDFRRGRLEKVLRMRTNLGLDSSPAFLEAFKRAPLLDALLLTYVLDNLGPNGSGRDCVLPLVEIQENADWSACLAQQKPFVLACFHAGPVVDGGWPARSAKVPVFHFARERGCRISPDFYETENMSAADFSILARDIVRAPAGVIMAPELGRGLRDTGLTVGGEKLWLSPFLTYIAHRMEAEVFFAHSKWTDNGISIDIVTGPRSSASQSRGSWEGEFNAAYAAQIKSIVSGEGLNNLRF